jgi:hypothetical protein
MQIQESLKRTKWSATRHKLEDIIRPRGGLTCGIDASSLLDDSADRRDDSIVQKIIGRINEVQVSTLAVHHRVTVRYIYYPQATSFVLDIHLPLLTEGSW